MSDAGASPAADVRAAAARELEQLREGCLRPDGGWSVLDAIALCAVHDMAMPRWLGAEYVRLRARVKSAEVATLDEAFGAYWPPRTRLPVERRHILLRKRVHAAVWELVRQNPGEAISRVLFDLVGEMAGIDISGSEVEKRYYEALDEGMLNVNTWRCIHLQPSRPSRSKRAKDKYAHRTPAA